MGSKASKLDPRSNSGYSNKLQPTVSQQDKAQMKEPDNYYTHRSKSMRRKAGKTPGGSGAAGEPGQSGVTGGGLA
ncbi:hypothetical protein P171DRAFT_435721 [Karstenula rhodostoma CBS 690.94]|uniref:Uncharacterized protein n=1 Tax=Karstenula rhodostoma CBS 690.94 TaxID=1392251 RepID=A0A9P4P7K2_9PLEO|nr:hypothetical protein P171DRAFT_435721 [Karstenula rhodostoma CBS 690.94]